MSSKEFYASDPLDLDPFAVFLYPTPYRPWFVNFVVEGGTVHTKVREVAGGGRVGGVVTLPLGDLVDEVVA